MLYACKKNMVPFGLQHRSKDLGDADALAQESH